MILTLLGWLTSFLLVFSLSTLVLATFGWSLGVRRLYVRVLLKIFRYARHVSSKHLKEKRNEFIVGGDPDTEESEIEEDGDSGFSPSPTKSCPDTTDSSLVSSSSSPHEVPRMASRHSVISRKDNIILSPDGLAGFDDVEAADSQAKNCELSPNSMALRLLGGKKVSAATFQREFQLSDVLEYVKTGVASIIEDEVTQRFEGEELRSWNLLTRTNHKFRFINWKLTFFWGFGCFFRYCILLPGRIAIFIVGLLYMALGMSVIGPVRDGPFKRWLNHQVTTSCFQVLGGAISAVITYHGVENRPKGGICVANHTSPIDVLCLACDNAYALTGQKHGGFLGQFQATLSKASPQIWFERGESKDRAAVFRRLKEHVTDPEKLPILIFPEGTCINNTSIMQFKKGSFEVGGAIYPVAIKYDPKFGEAFWNSSKFNMLTYIYMMMTSWAIVCDVWYLPPMYRKEGEDAIEFANRVKREIAKKGGLVDLVWDGNLKRTGVKKEWIAAQQENFSRRIKVD